MTTKEFIESLNISVDGNDFEIKGETYTLKLFNSDEYSQLFGIISSTPELTIDDDKSGVSEEGSKVQYSNDEFIVSLSADYIEDEYVLTVRRK